VSNVNWCLMAVSFALLVLFRRWVGESTPQG